MLINCTIMAREDTVGGRRDTNMQWPQYLLSISASNKVMVDRWAKQPSPYFSELGDEGEDLTLHGDLFKVEPLKEVGQKVSLVHQV